MRLSRSWILLLAACTQGPIDVDPVAETARPLAGAAPRFTTFESGHVRPLALSPNGRQLYVVNTPDSRLEIFDVKPNGKLEHRTSVTVGLEPVAVAAPSNDEVWVVNHLSDSVSIVRHHSDRRAHVARTLLVGDEPRDIVFAGPGRRRAFITTAHRGQNDPDDPQLFTEGIGRADVWVFDADDLGDTLGGTRVAKLTLFTDTPRALAVTPDGTRVYAAGFHTGNRTTSIHAGHLQGTNFEPLTCSDFFGAIPGLSTWCPDKDMLPPYTNFEGRPQPVQGVIAKFDGTSWRDSLGRIWDNFVRFSLPDHDVFVVDAMADPPQAIEGAAGVWSGVGTILFNMAVNPVSGKIYVSNTEARNEHRFEGHGTFAGTTVRGHLHESRVTVLSSGGAATPRHLNKHIDYSTCCAPIPNPENAKSLAFPQGLAVSPDGETLYVAALGSGKVGVFDTGELEADTFVPSTARQIAVTGGGPSGVVLDADGRRLYVMTRFDNGVSVINTNAQTEVQHVPLYNPEPPTVVNGRRFLYDAAHTSSHGDSACASCHVFGDLDSLAWDLGDPDGTALRNPIPILDLGAFALASMYDPEVPNEPMKGPMTTQSLRGMANHGSMHWRGDRTGGNEAPNNLCGAEETDAGVPTAYIKNAQPDCGIFDEDVAFRKFNPAFEGLLGRHAPLPEPEMQAFADFALELVYPPNPIRALDNSLTPDQAAGREIYHRPGMFPGGASCNTCHVLDPAGNRELGVAFPGFFGTDGSLAVKETPSFMLPMAMKVPHLRNAYQKVGMFGTPPNLLTGGDTWTHTGDQVRGFGYLHGGDVDNLFSFMQALAFERPAPEGLGFSTGGFAGGPAGDVERRQVASFVLAFDSNLAPIVGQQATLTDSNGAAVNPRVDLLVARALVDECELVAKTRVGARNQVGWLHDPASGRFIPDRAGQPTLSLAALRLLAVLSHPVTFTCVPVGSGRRVAIDADLDGHLDGDEDDAGSDPRDPLSF